MLHSDSKEFQDFAKAYEKAGQKIEEVLIKTRANSVNEYQIKVQKALDGISISLNQANKKWAEKDIKSGYNKGSDLVDKETNHKHTAPDYSKINDRPLNSYIQLSSSVSIATENAKRFVNQKIAELESSGEITISKVKQELFNSMRKEQNGLLSVRYRDGKQFRLDKYAEMTARTTRIETANKGVFDRCEDLGIDLVRCTTVPNCCPYCKKYEGKVYSISGKDSRYPALYKTALQSGYDIMHPNCRHEFLPFQEKLYTKQELSSIQKESNYFAKLDKKDNVFRQYNEQQAYMRNQNLSYLEYKRLKKYYGDKFPYKTLRGFRNAWNRNSETLKMVRSFNIMDEKGNIYHRTKDYFSEEERLKAWRFNDKIVADKTFVKSTKAVWSKLSEDERVAITRYTEDSGCYASYLRGKGDFYELSAQGQEYVMKQAKLVENILEKCELPKSITLKRSVRLDDVANGYFQTTREKFLDNIKDLKYYEGDDIEEKSFVSTSLSFDGDFAKYWETEEVVMEIYAPKNSKGLYLEPFSYYGGNKQNLKDIKRAVPVWDGEYDNYTPGGEIEVLLQKDSSFRVKKMFYDKDHKLHINVDLIRQGEHIYE